MVLKYAPPQRGAIESVKRYLRTSSYLHFKILSYFAGLCQLASVRHKNLLNSSICSVVVVHCCIGGTERESAYHQTQRQGEVV